MEALAHDSAAGRRTPSPALEKAAEYIAGRLRSAGLEPFGADDTFFQRYPLVESVLDGDSANIRIAGGPAWYFGRDFFYAAGGGRDPEGVIEAPLAIVTGKVTAATPGISQVAGKIVFFLSPLGPRGQPTDYRSAFALGGARARAVIRPGGRPDSLWLRLRTDPDEHKPSASAAWITAPVELSDSTQRFRPVLELWGGRWEDFVRASQMDTATLARADSTVRILVPGKSTRINFARRIERVGRPANVIALLPGSDPVLRHEYVIVTAHYDGLGSERGRPPGPASILNGADDNASGVAAMIDIAEFLSRGTRPRRSIIFAAVSGEENGLWGSDYLAMNPPVPREFIVANVNMDMIGRAKGDTVFVSGTHEKGIGPIAERTIRARGDLRLVIGDEAALERRFPGEKAQDRSDHASFRKRGVPAIAFFTGWHDDYHETTDDPPTLDYSALARITALVREITVSIANSGRGTR